MKNQLGIILLVIGIVMFIWGFNVSSSYQSKFSRALTGSHSNKVTMIFIAGGVCSAIGIYQLLSKKH
jgi:predicted MFS family arabinose efflux permease